MTTQKKVQSVPVTKPQPAVQEEMFTTDDFHCCAALMCAGHTFIKIDTKKLPHNDVFVLRRDDRIEIDARAYVRNTLILPAASYASEIVWLEDTRFGHCC